MTHLRWVIGLTACGVVLLWWGFLFGLWASDKDRKRRNR